jgi:uncharacterized protein (TIGR02246 family)
MSVAAHAGDSPTKKLDDQFLKAFNAGDIDGLVALYADDAVIYPPDAFMVKGKDAIRANWKSFYAQFKVSNATITDAKYIDMDDKSVGWGIVEATMTPVAGGAQMPMKARFTSISEKRDGKWLYIVDHASMPMGPPPAEMTPPPVAK